MNDSVRVEQGQDDGAASANMVRLRGRISSGATERQLPSGTVVVSFRLSVPRARSPMTAGSRQVSDWVDCSVWGARIRRTTARWAVGDVVEVEGALRRRFHRGPSGTSTRLEVEVLSGRRVARAGSPGRSRRRAPEDGAPDDSTGVSG